MITKTEKTFKNLKKGRHKMIEKLTELVNNDELLLHKIGLAIGTVVGILIGAIVTKRADDFEILPTHEIVEPEEISDGPQED